MNHYKQGQNVICRVDYVEKDGYAVTVLKDNFPGYIKTANRLKPGDQILGVFVCVHQGRILLSQLFSAPRATKQPLQQPPANGEENLDSATTEQPAEPQELNSRHRRLGIVPPTVLPPQPGTDSERVGGENVIRLDFKKRKAKKDTDKP